MIGMRNVIAHNYSTIDIDKLWSAATDGTAALLVVLEPLLGQDPDVPDV
jgi:uncharacterized protein with HEPN domain